MDDGCDDTPKNPGCWSNTGTPPCDGITSNNMMDYNACQCAITPCQLAKIHYNFWKENSSQRTALLNNWCAYDSVNEIVIPKDETIIFENSRELNTDVIISEGATLEVRCILALPTGAKIVVKPTAKLIVNGGIITSRCGGLWNGIEIWQSKKLGLAGIVEFANGGSVDNVKYFAPDTLYNNFAK